ncbi:TonB-dependent receptor [Microbulbifer spongiae]|uniref:TonB-dependent receptor n=1 Tax=Microbulbifer spongiae TaxID=2944933 RepID=A0ABY9EC38_9GAMM|nr:TonB-dependent receptor [Microbulbifer sp. MI-G]WKD49039.1 TonB-dependent receptor [Microbulbifer sp. MI-G]
MKIKPRQLYYLLLKSLTPVVFLVVDPVYGEGLVLEEITVTSERRSESLQKVPISITAFEQVSLEKRGIDELDDLGASIPNLSVSPFPSDNNTARLIIRGLGQLDAQITQDPAVALYIDGVYVGSSIGSGLEVVDLQRVEILRGPQGSLYGRNSTGGAVNLIVAKPVLGEFGFKQALTGGNLGHFKSRTNINFPLGETAALKLSALISKRDGTVEAIGDPLDYGAEDREAYRVDISGDLIENLRLDYAYDTSDVKDTSRYEQVIAGGDLSTVLVGPILSQFLSSSLPPNILVNVVGIAEHDIPAQADRLDRVTAVRPLQDNLLEINGHNLTLTWNISEYLIIKSITGYREVNNSFFHDSAPSVRSGIGIALAEPAFGLPAGTFLVAAGPLGATSQGRRTLNFQQKTQEFQFIGSTNFIEYVAGAYFYSDRAYSDLVGISFNTARAYEFTDSKNESLAVFGQLTFVPNDSYWSYTLGARYAKDSRQAFRFNPNSPSFAASAPFGALYDRDFSNFDPSLTITYDIDKDSSIYGKVVSGYKSGGTSTRSSNLALYTSGFVPEETLAYELGFKGEFLDNRVRLNVAVFKMDVDNYQTSVQTGTSSAERDFIGINGVEINGIELDLQIALVENLRASLSLGLLHSDLGGDILRLSGLPDTTLIDGLPYAPEKSGTFSFDYALGFGRWKLDAFLGYNYQGGERHSSVNSADSVAMDSYGVIDAAISLSMNHLDKHESKLTFWGKNLADKEYLITNFSGTAVPFGQNELVIFGDPKTFGMTVSYAY